MPFVGRTVPWMRQVVGFEDRSTGRSNFGANIGGLIVTNGDFTIWNSHWAAARLLLGEFLELQALRACEPCRLGGEQCRHSARCGQQAQQRGRLAT